MAVLCLKPPKNMNEKQEKYIKKIISRNLAIEWGKQKKKKIPWWNLWDKLVMDIWIARQ